MVPQGLEGENTRNFDKLRCVASSRSSVVSGENFRLDRRWLAAHGQRSGQSSGRMKIRAFVGLKEATYRTEREGSNATRKLPGMPQACCRQKQSGRLVKASKSERDVSSAHRQGIYYFDVIRRNAQPASMRPTANMRPAWSAPDQA